MRRLGQNKNNMRWKIVSILVLFCLLFDRSITQAQADPVNELIQRVNALRRAYGVPEYQVDYALMYAAQAEAEWGLANKHFGHDGPGGSTPDDRAKAAGYGAGESSFTIENVAAGTASLNTPELVVTMWQNDWGHLNAMISADYEHIGVGFAEADDFSYYVMMVGWVGTKASSGNNQEQENPEVNVPSEPFVKSTPDESGAIYHEVQPGQSAWTIAAQYGIELAELLELNNLTADSILHPGDILMIRPPDPPTSTPTITPTPIRSTDIPTSSPTPIHATEVPIESDTHVDQSQEEASASSTPSSVPLVVGVGLVLLVGVVIVMRFRKP
jgi:LysM repeat protein